MAFPESRNVQITLSDPTVYGARILAASNQQTLSQFVDHLLDREIHKHAGVWTMVVEYSASVVAAEAAAAHAAASGDEVGRD